jgi:hypothetical protein
MSNLEQLVIELDTFKKYRGKFEFTTVNRAVATYNNKYYEFSGYGQNIYKLIESVHEDNPQNNPIVHVERAGNHVFIPKPLNQWLGLGEDGEKLDNRPEWLKETTND